MDGYSKIRAVDRPKSRSIDFQDLSLSPPAKIPQPQITKTSNKICESLPNDKHLREEEEEEEEERGKTEADVGEMFGAILSRSCSVSSATSASQRFGGTEKNQQQSHGVQSAFKRAFSLRRSSSVSEGYCRIHEQRVSLSSPPPCDGLNVLTRSKKKKKRGRFLNACKRLFGFSYF